MPKFYQVCGPIIQAEEQEMKSIILDLDNCISDDEWRLHHINHNAPIQSRYHDYHSLCGFDLASNFHLLSDKTNIFILTSRPEAYRAVTCEWLERKGVLYQKVFMRENHDYRPSVEVKRTHLESMARSGFRLKNISHAYDDKQEIVNMYREYGIPAERKFIYELETK